MRGIIYVITLLMHLRNSVYTSRGVFTQETLNNVLVFLYWHSIVMTNIISTMDHSTGTITNTNIGTNIGSNVAQRLAPSLARHDHKLMIKKVLFMISIFFFSFLWVFQQKSILAWTIGIIIWKLRKTQRKICQKNMEVWANPHNAY